MNTEQFCYVGCIDNGFVCCCFQIFNDLPPHFFRLSSDSSLLHQDGLESKLLGRGGYGSVYRARLQNTVKIDPCGLVVFT